MPFASIGHDQEERRRGTYPFNMGEKNEILARLLRTAALMDPAAIKAAALDELTLKKVNDFVDDDLLSCFLCARRALSPSLGHPLSGTLYFHCRSESSGISVRRGGRRKCCRAARVGEPERQPSKGELFGARTLLPGQMPFRMFRPLD